MSQEEIKDELLTIRNELVDSLPVGNIGAFDIIVKIQGHIKKVDNLIDKIYE